MHAVQGVDLVFYGTMSKSYLQKLLRRFVSLKADKIDSSYTTAVAVLLLII